MDLIENLHDLKLHSVCKVENISNTDPNANSQQPGFHSLNNKTAELVTNVNYARQDSGHTLVNEDLDQSGELEWDEDVTSTNLPSAITLESSQNHSSALLPGVWNQQLNFNSATLTLAKQWT